MKSILLIIFILLFSACSNNSSVEEKTNVNHSWGKMKGLDKLVGNMHDTSYSTVRNLPPRANAFNEKVKIESFEGKYLWAEYAASWCNTCKKQVHQVKQAEAILPPQEINFITVMTGKSQKYGDHATVQTAKTWAQKYQLDGKKVFAAELWYKTIPEHRLFSPQGHTLFVHVGYLSTQQILDTIAFYKKDWDAYQSSGTYADWMH